MRLGKVGIGLGALVIAAAGWSAAWLWAAREAGRQVDAWLAAEAMQGRTWTCPARSIGGYPLAITLACSDPTFAATAMGRGVEAGLAHLTAEVALWHPRRIAVALAPPFAYKTSDDSTNLGATWASLTVVLDGLPDLAAVMVKGTRIAVSGTFGGEGRQSGSATRLEASFTMPLEARRAPVDDPTIGFAIALDGLPIAALDDLVGGVAASDVALSGTLDHADIGDARTPEEAIEHWRADGGTLQLDSGRIARNGAKATASGTLTLDEAHRLKGRLDAQFVGLEPILARYGIGGNLAAAGSLLSTLFGGGKPAAPVEPGALALPISLRHGRLGVGPIDTGVVLPPLY